jgi:hypothetical protein
MRARLSADALLANTKESDNQISIRVASQIMERN